MQLVDIVIKQLRSEQINAYYEAEGRIAWTDQRNEEHCIDERHIAYGDNRIAWFQSDLDSQYLLRVFDGNGNFNWEPVTHNPVFGCDCLFIKWYGDKLIFIYQEKHDIYICSIQNSQVATFNFRGDQIVKRGDLVYFKPYGPDTGWIQRFDLSSFSALEPMASEQAQLENVYPHSVDGIIGLDEQ